MKKILFLALTLIISSTLVACSDTNTTSNSDANNSENLTSTTPAPDGYTNYKKEWVFSAMYPKDWSMQEDFMGTIALFSTPQEWEDDDINENVNFITQNISEVGAADFEEYIDINLTQLEWFLTDFEVKSQKNVEVKWLPWAELIYEFTQWELKISTTQYILSQDDGEIFVVTLTQSQDNPTKFTEEFNAIVDSLEIF